jgi:hypothetical protein
MAGLEQGNQVVDHAKEIEYRTGGNNWGSPE